MPADTRLRQLGQAHQQVTFAPRIVGAPSGAARLAPDARVEHVTGGEVAIGPLRRRELRRIALLTAQAAEAAEWTAPILRVAVTPSGDERHQEEEHDGRDLISSGRSIPALCERSRQAD